MNSKCILFELYIIIFTCSGDGTVTTSFLPTPPTPSYLIAFIVSDFLQSNNGNNPDFPHATYARPNAIHGANYSVDVGERILKAFDDYITIPFSYSLPKMDQVAVPDFAAGKVLMVQSNALTDCYDINT